MAGFKLMDNFDYMGHLQSSNLISNLNQGMGVPEYLEGTTIQKLVNPTANLSNPAYSQESTFIADNTLAQSNYMNPRRMR
jgi:hypothetical protein